MRLVRMVITESGGELVKVIGDGIAVRCGVHTGELQRDGMDITGITVHIGARVAALAGPGEVLVSRTVRDLVAGSGLGFISRGEQQLKEVADLWEVYAVAHASDQVGTVPLEESLQTPVDSMVIQGARRAPRLSRAALRMANAMERRRARSD